MLDFRQSLLNSTLNQVLKRLPYPLAVMLACMCWYVLVCGIRGQNHANPEVGFFRVNLRGPDYTDTDVTITSARGDPVAVSRAQTH